MSISIIGLNLNRSAGRQNISFNLTETRFKKINKGIKKISTKL